MLLRTLASDDSSYINGIQLFGGLEKEKAYLSWIALVGIGLNTIWRIGWADAAAALIIVPLIVREGFQSMRRRLLLNVPYPQ